MLVKKPAIKKETRKKILENFSSHFQFREGEDLNLVVLEVLNDRDIFTFLSPHLKEKEGLRLDNDENFSVRGKIWEGKYIIDGGRNFYGLTIDSRNLPKKASLFTYEVVDVCERNIAHRLYIGNRFPEGYSNGVLPSVKDFIERVNVVIPLALQYSTNRDFHEARYLFADLTEIPAST